MTLPWSKMCAVTICHNTKARTPAKIFIRAPKSLEMRNKWIKLAGLDPNQIPITTTIYFCEDHFNLPYDMTNYMKYRAGCCNNVRMRADCLPSKFEIKQDISPDIDIKTEINSLVEAELSLDTDANNDLLDKAYPVAIIKRNLQTRLIKSMPSYPKVIVKKKPQSDSKISVRNSPLTRERSTKIKIKNTIQTLPGTDVKCKRKSLSK